MSVIDTFRLKIAIASTSLLLKKRPSWARLKNCHGSFLSLFESKSEFHPMSYHMICPISCILYAASATSYMGLLVLPHMGWPEAPHASCRRRQQRGRESERQALLSWIRGWSTFGEIIFDPWTVSMVIWRWKERTCKPRTLWPRGSFHLWVGWKG